MKLLKTRARCSRAHLLFVGLLLAIYLATLVFFHVELQDSAAPPPAEAVASHNVDAFERTPIGHGLDHRPRRLQVTTGGSARKRIVWNRSTTTARPLEHCADVFTPLTANDSDIGDRTPFLSRPRRHPINLACSSIQRRNLLSSRVDMVKI